MKYLANYDAVFASAHAAGVRLKPEFKALWLTALRSGNYHQGRGWLRMHVGGSHSLYCCLGVGYDLSCALDPSVFRWAPRDGENAYETAGGEATVLWADVLETWFVPDSSPRFIAVATALYGLNDDGATFEQIADLIEKYL